MKWSILIWCVYMEQKGKLKFEEKFKNKFYNMCCIALEAARKFYVERNCDTENFPNKDEEYAFLEMATQSLPSDYHSKIKHEYDLLEYASNLLSDSNYQ